MRRALIGLIVLGMGLLTRVTSGLKASVALPLRHRVTMGTCRYRALTGLRGDTVELLGSDGSE